jgi:hypothetical protein
MTRLTDETLMLFADGMLDRSEGERVGRLVAEDPDLRARLNVFRVTGRGLARLFDEHMNTPIPAKLQELFAGQGAAWANAPAFRPRRTDGAAFIAQRLRGLRVPAWNAPAALAAGLALCIGMGLGWLLRGGPVDEDSVYGLVQADSNRLIARGALARGLETSRSGSDITTVEDASGQARIRVRMTFRNEARDFCRQYEIATAAAARHSGVACRIGGQWVVTVQALLPPSQPAPDRIVLAGSGDNAVMEAAVGAMIEGDPLGRDEETAVLGKGWR